MTKLVDKQSGQEVEVPDESAAQAVASGQFAGTPGETVKVRSKAGTVGTLDASELGSALSQGFELANDKEYAQAAHDADLEERYGGVGGQLATGAINVGDAALFGAGKGLLLKADEAINGKESADQSRRAVAEAEETNRGSALAGQTVGMLLPTGLGELGGLAEKGVAGLVGREATSVAGRLAQRALPSAARGAAEMAAYGAGSAVTEAEVGDEELNAEKVLAHAGKFAIFGAGLGGALSTAGGLLSEGARAGGDAVSSLVEKLRPKDVEALAEKHFGDAAPGLGDAYVKASSVASGGDAKAIESLGIQDLSKEAAERRSKAVFEGDTIREEAKRAVRTQIDELNQATGNLQEEFMGGLKRGHVENSIRKGDEALGQQIEFAQNQAAAVRGRVEEMLNDPTAYGEVAKLKKMQRSLDLADRGIEKGSAPDAFMALDQLKRDLGGLSRAGERFGSGSADKAASFEARELYENLRQGLEDEGIWGKAAEDQQRINQAWSKYIGTKRLFDQRLSTTLGRDASNPWVDALTADPAKIDGYVNGLTSAKNDLIHSTIKEHLANSADLADAVSKLNDLDAGKLAEVGKVFRSTEAFGKTIGKAEESLVLSNQLRSLLQSESSGGFGSAAGLIGGAAFGGPLGAAAGLAAGALLRPGQSIRQLAAIERVLGTVDMRIGDGIKNFFGGVKKAAGEAVSGARAATARAVPRAAAILEEKGKTKQQVYRDYVDQIAKLSADPGTLAANATGAMGDAHEHAPKTTQAVTMKAGKALAFLQSKLPMTAPTNFLRPELDKHVEPSDSEMHVFANYLAAVMDPMSVVDDLNSSHINPESVEAIQEVYPKLYEQIRNKTWEQIGQLEEEPSFEKKLELGILFDLPTDLSLQPDFMNEVQSMWAQLEPEGSQKAGQGEAPGHAPQRKVDTVSRYQTGVNRLEMGADA